jgi:hypothetical protein
MSLLGIIREWLKLKLRSVQKSWSVCRRTDVKTILWISPEDQPAEKVLKATPYKHFILKLIFLAFCPCSPSFFQHPEFVLRGHS